MSNRSIWNVRKRHEWLATPKAGKHLSRRKRARVGLEDALLRKQPKGEAAEPAASTEQ